MSNYDPLAEMSTDNLSVEELVPVGYKKTEVGVIPEDWDVKSVSEAFEVCNNLRFPISSQDRARMAGPYPYYGPTKIQDYLNEYRVEGEYALIGEDGDHFLKFDSMSQTQLAAGRFNVNNHAHLIKGKVGSARWFFLYFRNKDISLYLTRQGAGRFKLNKASLERIPCALPSSKEQIAIAKALSDVDELLNSLDKLIAKKQAIKTATMQQLLTGKTRLPAFAFREDGTRKGYKDSELGEIPEDWEIITIGDNCRTFAGGTPTTSNKSYYGGNIQWINSSDLNKAQIYNVEGRITNEGLQHSSAKEIKAGTFLIALYGATAGVCAISQVDAAINQAVLAVIPRGHSSKYLFYWFSMNKDKIIENILKEGSQIWSGDIIRLISLPIANTEEQTAIATILSDMDTEIQTLEKRLSKTRQIKQGMMQELLTGKTRLVKPEAAA
ncbi:MAG: restriction endonuclease subunit S [Hahellaceae bacterium]|nr:restriction endonuclease subunit S [Hahellaceae bacterium]